jgi:hypothetical protein
MNEATQKAIAEFARIIEEAKKSHEAELARVEWERS